MKAASLIDEGKIKMNIKNLIEDTSADNGCIHEHGLSFYVETMNHKLLVDAGASDKFIKNAEKLNIDLTQVDTLFLSHGHYDHSGGIIPFANINPQAQIYIHEKADGEYYSEKPDRTYYAGIDKEISKLPQTIKVSKDTKIDNELFIYTNVTGRFHWPQGNKKLKKLVDGELIQDEFDHEQYLIIKAEGEQILMSGCAHNGILNILEKYIELEGHEPDVIISGFHMMKSSEYTQEEVETIQQTAYELKKYKTKYYTGHCTGEPAFKIMKEILGEQIEYVRSGEELDI